jgi:hypothetical protein
MKTFHTFDTAQQARDYRHVNGTGGWIFVCDKTGNATLFPPCMAPTAIMLHPMTHGMSGDLIGHG